MHTCRVSDTNRLALACLTAQYRTLVSWCLTQKLYHKDCFGLWEVTDGSFLTDEDFGEGCWSILACLLVTVESDSCCAHPTALWTDEGLDWGWLGCCSLFLLPAFFLEASCLSASNLQLAFLTDGHQPSRSEASCSHDWWLIPACASCLFSWSLYHFLEAPQLHFPSWSSLKNTALGISTSSILETWPAQHSCTWSKKDSMLGRLALLRTSSFDTWSCYLMPRMECM